jgi:hypothetical protein
MIMKRLVQITCLIIAGVILVACNLTSEDLQPPETDSARSKIPSNIPGENTPEISPISDENTPTGEPTQDRALRLTTTVIVEKINPADFPISTPIVGEVPDAILEKIITDLVNRTNPDKQKIKVIRSESITWNDGALGCPKPGEFYTQALVNGYWVILQVDETSYDYRVSDSGYFTLCEGKGGIPLTPPGEISPEK